MFLFKVMARITNHLTIGHMFMIWIPDHAVYYSDPHCIMWCKLFDLKRFCGRQNNILFYRLSGKKVDLAYQLFLVTAFEPLSSCDQWSFVELELGVPASCCVSAGDCYLLNKNLTQNNVAFKLRRIQCNNKRQKS